MTQAGFAQHHTDVQAALDAVSLHPDWIMNAQLGASKARGTVLSGYIASLGVDSVELVREP
jgi:hypothetical protein